MRKHSVFQAAALAWTALTCLPTGAAADVPAFVRHHEAASAEIRSPRAGDAAPRITLHALGRDLVLDLAPSPAFSPDFVVREVGADATTESAGAVQAWQGSVAGDPESRVAVAMVDGTLDGLVAIDGETIFIEPARRWYDDAGRGDIIAYRASDVDTSSLNIACGAQSDATAMAALAATLDSGLSRPRSARGVSLDLLSVAMVADYEMYQYHGGSTTSYLSSILNQVSLIYQNDLSVLLQANSFTVYTTNADPFTSTTPEVLLDEFGTLRATDGGAIHAAGLGHLYTGKDLAGNVVGIAYLGTLCANSTGVGLSEYFTANNYIQTLLTAHEMGHNFGAPHDNQGGSACSATPFGFIMNPSISDSLADEFSTCSLGFMEAEVAAASCISAAIPTDCGDGNLDVGEDCDDGNNLSGDCCALNCIFELANSSCEDDADICTDDVCDGAGTCTHPFNTAPCDDGDTCTLPGTCSAGSCQASVVATPLAAAAAKVKIKGGGEDKFAAKAKMYGALASPPNVAGFTVRLSDGMGTVYEGTIPAVQFASKNGVKFEFRDSGQVLPPEVNSLVQVKIAYKAAKGLLTVKAKGEGLDLSDAASEPSLSLRMEIGDTSIGDCGTSTIPCSGTTDLKCKF